MANIQFGFGKVHRTDKEWVIGRFECGDFTFNIYMKIKLREADMILF